LERRVSNVSVTIHPFAFTAYPKIHRVHVSNLNKSKSVQSHSVPPSVTVIDEPTDTIAPAQKKSYRLNTRKVTHVICKTAREAQVMANAIESAGADVFSITESGGTWQIWCKYRKDSTPKHFQAIFNEEQELYERSQRTQIRNGRLQMDW
jgi:hypothetical protein